MVLGVTAGDGAQKLQLPSSTMASRSDRRTSLRLDLPQGPPLESPPGIAALFLIRFDIKRG